MKGTPFEGMPVESIIALVLIIIFVIWRKNKNKKPKRMTLDEYIANTSSNNIEKIDNFFKVYVMDKDSGIFTIYERTKKVFQPKQFQTSIKNIISVELIEDENSLISVNIGSQLVGMAVGGALLGGVGAIVGGLSGSKTAQNKCGSLKLKFLFDDINYPTDEIIFLKNKGKKGYDKNGIEYQNAYKQADHWLSIFKILMKKESDNPIETTYKEIELPLKTNNQ